jgi:hypothetical protein
MWAVSTLLAVVLEQELRPLLAIPILVFTTEKRTAEAAY